KRVIGYTPESSDTVVEIGCGVGRLTRVIAPEVGRVIALDISEKMLAIARQANLPNVDFRLAQGFALPGIPDKSVDLSVGYCVFQHLPSRTALKSYLREHLSSGGPKGVYRKEWVGIRPRASDVFDISPVQFQRQALDAGRILY